MEYWNDGEHFWSVPLDLETSTQYQIKITDASNSSTFAFSENFEIYCNSITVTTPSSSTSWELGSSNYIYWVTTGIYDLVDISLYKAGSFERLIISSTSNDGEYYWLIPEDLVPDNDYTIQIEATHNMTIGDMSQPFELRAISNSIWIITPNSNCTWITGEIYTISWDSIGDISFVDIELYYFREIRLIIALETKNDGEYFWAIPSGLEDSMDYQIKVIDSSDSSIYDYSEYFKILSNFLPNSIIISSPSNGNSWKTDNSYYISWTSTGAISNVKIELYRDGLFQMIITSETSDDGQYYWSIPTYLISSTQYQIKITDVADNTVFDYSDIFEITSDELGPNYIPTYNLLLLICLLVGISLIIIKKQLRKNISYNS